MVRQSLFGKHYTRKVDTIASEYCVLRDFQGLAFIDAQAPVFVPSWSWS